MIRTDHATPELERIVAGASRLDLIAQGLLFGEGPLWHAQEGALYWVDILGDTIHRWTPGVGREVVLHPSTKANGLTLDFEGRLLCAGWASRSVWRREHDGTIVDLATEWQGRRINTPNDLVVRSDGSIYWTDSSGALFIPGMAGEDVQRYLDTHPVFRVFPDDGRVELVTEAVSYPNGLAFSPDESILYVADTWSRNVQAFDVAPDGTLAGGGRVFYALVGEEPGVADGMKVDVEGNVYVTGPAGIHVIAPDGRLLGRIKVPGHTTNLAWGEDDWRTLFVTTYSSVYRMRLGIPGMPVPTVPAAEAAA